MNPTDLRLEIVNSLMRAAMAARPPGDIIKEAAEIEAYVLYGRARQLPARASKRKGARRRD